MVSAILGVLIGIILTNYQYQKAARVQKARRIHALKESIEFNIRLIDDALTWCSKGGLGNFPLDSSTLGDRISNCIDDFDAKFIREVNWERFQLDHITFKITLINLKVVATTDTGNPRHQLSDISGHLTLTKKRFLELLCSCEGGPTTPEKAEPVA